MFKMNVQNSLVQVLNFLGWDLLISDAITPSGE